jgi:phenylacetate-coenzyme A ligase PaaK-like adenylate-forming protein
MCGHPTFAGLALDTWRAEQARPEEIAARQSRRLADLVAYARQSSPAYRHRYRHLPPVAGSADLPNLPPVTKPELMAAFDDWVTDPAVTRAGVDAFVADKSKVGEMFLGRYFLCLTSGSTGTPGIFLHDDDALRVALALGLRVERAWMTPRMMAKLVRSGSRTAAVVATGDHFLGYGTIARTHKQFRHLRALTERARTFSVMAPLDHLVRDLNLFQPARLMSYPTMLALLADEQEAGRLHIAPTIIIPAGEWLAPAVRQKLARVFRCVVRDGYSASECQTIAYDCGHGWLHVHSDWVILEPVDQEYRPVPPGQPSHTVLLTNLANRIQPIIRYDLGDSVTINPERCTCGSPLPAIRVEGRRDETLHLRAPGGQVVPVPPMAIATVVEDAGGVRRYQVIQTASDTLRIRLEAAPGRTEAAIWPAVVRDMQAYLDAHGATRIRIERDLVPPTPHPVSGKFRHVWAEPTAGEPAPCPHEGETHGGLATPSHMRWE